MQHEKTIEQKVADAILERSKGEIEIDGTVYPIGAPSIATLILVSEIISTLPVVQNVQSKDVLPAVLHYAKDYKALGELAAVFILGAKNLTAQISTEVEERRLWGLIRRKKGIQQTIDRKAELAEKILLNISPSVLSHLIISRLENMEIGDFFAITTSLSAANLLKPTREVD